MKYFKDEAFSSELTSLASYCDISLDIVGLVSEFTEIRMSRLNRYEDEPLTVDTFIHNCKNFMKIVVQVFIGIQRAVELALHRSLSSVDVKDVSSVLLESVVQIAVKGMRDAYGSLPCGGYRFVCG